MSQRNVKNGLGIDLKDPKSFFSWMISSIDKGLVDSSKLSVLEDLRKKWLIQNRKALEAAGYERDEELDALLDKARAEGEEPGIMNLKVLRTMITYFKNREAGSPVEKSTTTSKVQAKSLFETTENEPGATETVNHKEKGFGKAKTMVPIDDSNDKLALYRDRRMAWSKEDIEAEAANRIAEDFSDD